MNGHAPLNEADLRRLVMQWDINEPSDDVTAAARFENILSRLEWFGLNQWADYLPAKHPQHSARYLARLAQWVGNVEGDGNRKLMLEYALHVAFFSHADLCALYRTAFSGPITRWVVEQEKLSLDDADFQTRLTDELHQRTWYCPVTDSMDINEFYHANLVTGISHRPGFAAMRMLDEQPLNNGTPGSGVVDGLNRFIANPDPRASAPPLKRLVLLEDFVGSGTQSAGALKWTAKKLDIPILFIPLVVCEPGLTELSRIASTQGARMRINPLLKLGARDLLGAKRGNADGIPNAAQIETLARNTFEQVAGGPHLDAFKSPHTPFGFKETGASFVSYSNTPNNTLPMLHHRPASGGWHPLFPRSARV